MVAFLTIKDYGTNLTFHRVRVDLTHVFSSILLLHVAYVQIPCAEITMCNGHSRVMCDDVIMNCLNGLSVRLHPSYLYKRIYVNGAICYACRV